MVRAGSGVRYPESCCIVDVEFSLNGQSWKSLRPSETRILAIQSVQM